jgi:Icc-related predicted phosphoesterase
MKILVVADIHGEYQKLDKVLDKAGSDYDLVICPGDITDMFNIPQHFSQEDVANLVIQKLLALNKPLLCVPGNQDPYETIDMLNGYDANLHGKIKTAGGLSLLGWGGALTPFNTLFEPTEEETGAALKALSTKIAGDFVLVVHNPPKGTKLDKIPSGEHVGSKAIADFIVEKKPLLAISAHMHENAGTDKLGETTLFYPGPAYEGWYGIVEISGKKVKCTAKQAKV